jgi:hypothetical protein
LSAPVLTIAIPTYNRAPKLARLLDNTIAELGPLLGETVELVVSDNCSTDNTQILAKERLKRPGCSYYRNASNVGFDGNVLNLLRNSRGEFVWIMGDDDLFEAGFLPQFVNILSRNEADLYIVPDRRMDHPPSNNLASHFGIQAPTIAPLIEFLIRFGLFGIVGGIGHNVFRRTQLTHLEEYVARKTAFCHVFAIARSFVNSRTIFLIDPGIVVPAMTPEEGKDYAERWSADGLWIDGMWNCFSVMIELFEQGILPSPIPQNFFRMMFDQEWPFHFHVYNALAKKLFLRNEKIEQDVWDKLSRFDALLGSERYSDILKQLYLSSGLKESLAEAALNLTKVPAPVYKL